MAYFDTQLATPPPVTITVPGEPPGTAILQEGMGMGYPVGGTDEYFPNSPAIPPVATNPHGVVNSPDEFPAILADPPTEPFAYAYSVQTFEERIAAMVPPGVPVVPVTVAPNEPYPVS
jgi:hypothetical protein